jgi:catechol-2,3-dioxygenase
MERVKNKRVTVLAVKDLQRSTNFYLSCLGARAQHKEPGLFVQIGINDKTIRLVPKTGGNSTHPENFTYQRAGHRQDVRVPESQLR